MSAPFAINDVILITYFGRYYGQVIESVNHYRVMAPFTAPSTGELEGLMLASFLSQRTNNFVLDAYLAAAEAEFEMEHIQVQRIFPTRSIYAREPIGIVGDNAGGATGICNLAISIEKQSATVGRKGVGRLQFAPFPADAIGGGGIDPAYQATYMVPLANSMVGSVSDVSMPGFSMISCLPAAAGGGAAYDLWNAFPRPELRTMHRRTVGLGI